MIDSIRSDLPVEIAAFAEDPETARAESTLGELIATYRENKRIEQVLTKVVTINALYHARVLDVDLHPLAVHICCSRQQISDIHSLRERLVLCKDP